MNAFYNDTENSLWIEFETGSFETHIIDLYNIIGQRIRQDLYIPTSSSINLITMDNLNLASGSYFIVISKAGGGISDSRPFVAANGNP